MKAHQEGLAHLFDPQRSWVRSDSFVRSLILSTVVGLLVAWVGIAMFALSRYLHVPWTMAAAAGVQVKWSLSPLC